MRDRETIEQDIADQVDELNAVDRTIAAYMAKQLEALLEIRHLLQEKKS